MRQAIDDPGELIENSWLFARHADPALADHDMVLLKVSIIAVAHDRRGAGRLCWFAWLARDAVRMPAAGGFRWR